MTSPPNHTSPTRSSRLGWWLLLAAFALTLATYWSGLSGGFLFDDYPNIVDNRGVQPNDASVASLVNAALSSPASEFKRPLASLSFALNYLASGINPYGMKLTNLVIHLLNGLLVFLLSRELLRLTPKRENAAPGAHSRAMSSITLEDPAQSIGGERPPTTDGSLWRTATSAAASDEKHAGMIAALIAAGWMLLPINLTGVLYVVQRMESMANLFVLLGLIGYVAGRQRMLGMTRTNDFRSGSQSRISSKTYGFLLCVASITLPVAVGILAKETAVMLPLYALLVEWTMFGLLLKPIDPFAMQASRDAKPGSERRILILFVLVLVVPMVLGLAWLLPGVLRAETWASRDFTLTTRLLSEARIITDYIAWTLLPTPDALSFYHDNFRVSQGLLTPWTTLTSIAFLAGLIALMFWLRQRLPLAALGIALFFSCQLLTGTILPLELIYEHRNYFASFGLLLAVVPLLAAPRTAVLSLPRHVLLGALMVCWTALTALTAYAWGNPLRLAEDLASRAPQSPRAEYELGRTYIVYSHYDPTSPFTKLAYAPLERAAALPNASILPEQALIFMNARMHIPLKNAWWDSLITKLKTRKPGVQDESSLGALTQCVRENRCDLPKARMLEAFMAALTHSDPSARLLATYGDYAWNVLDDHVLGESMIQDAVKTSPKEPAYQVTLIRMLAAQGRNAEALKALQHLQTLNYGGRLNSDVTALRALLEPK